MVSHEAMSLQDIRAWVHLPISFGPLLALFGKAELLTPSIRKFEGQAILLCTLLAKRLILQNWKSDSVPQFQLWLRDMGNVLHMERIRYNLREMILSLKLGSPSLVDLLEQG